MNQEDYLNDGYHDSYKRQLDFYNYLLRGEGLTYLQAASSCFQCKKGYADLRQESNLTFDYHLIEYKWMIHNRIISRMTVLNYEVEAVSNPCCKHCVFVQKQKYAESPGPLWVIWIQNIFCLWEGASDSIETFLVLFNSLNLK